MEFKHRTLDNGLEIVAECNPRAYSFGLAFFVNAGSRDESDQNAGVSHFLEHMAFKGSSRRSAEDLNRELDEIGSHSNAYTSEENTVYYLTALPEYQDRAIELLADMLRPSLRESDFDMEKQVIIEEICKYEDQPPFNGHDKCMALHFGGHPLGRSVLGTPETIGALTPEQMRSYFQSRYSPSNILLAGAGNIDFDRLCTLAEKFCGHWETFAAERQTPLAPPNSGFHVQAKESAAQQYTIQLARGPGASDDDRHAGRIMATMLGDDSGSRLYWDLVETGLADFASVGSNEYQGTGVLMTYIGCDPERLEEVLAHVRQVQIEAERNGFTEDELRQAVNKTCSYIVLRAERPGNRMFAVGKHWLQQGYYQTVQEVIAKYQSLKIGDISEMLEKYPLSTNTTFTIGPLSEVNAPGQS